MDLEGLVRVSYIELLATIRSKGFFTLATASFGIATSILSGGRNAYSYFKISIDVDENINCNISKQTSLDSLIRDIKLIVWDKASMTKEKIIEPLDLILKDLMDTKMFFGGKVIVLGDEFRQTLLFEMEKIRLYFTNFTILTNLKPTRKNYTY